MSHGPEWTATDRSDARDVSVPSRPSRRTCGHECECHPLVHAISEAKAGHHTAATRLFNLIDAVEMWCADEGIES